MIESPIKLQALDMFLIHNILSEAETQITFQLRQSIQVYIHMHILWENVWMMIADAALD